MKRARISVLFDAGFDASAKESFDRKPIRLALAVVLGAVFALGLGWRAMALWLAAVLLLEGASWLYNVRRPYPEVASDAQRIRHSVAVLVIGLLWTAPLAMMWLSGDPALQTAAAVQWMANLAYAQLYVGRSRGYTLLMVAPTLSVALALSIGFSPHDGPAAWTAQLVVVLALVNGVLGLGDVIRRADDLRRATAKIEQERAAAEAANAAKSAFLAMMSHELRTPMNGVLGMAHALRASRLSKAQREQVDLILESGDGLMTVLNDVLDLSKIEAGRLELLCAPLDPRELIEQGCRVWLDAAAEKGVALAWSVDEAVPPAIQADAARLRQMLHNLVSNALKFTSEGAVTVRLERRDDRLVLSVNDTGPGILEAVQARLFEAFTQADAGVSHTYGGTGLGLAITKRLAGLMGGSVGLQSQVGEGSTFHVDLPLIEADIAADPAPEAPSGAEAPSSAERPLRVLGVDDNATNRAVLGAFLKALGAEGTLADSAAEAFEQMERQAFDLVLMDIHMPGLDGEAALAEIRAGRGGQPDVPVVALTADAMAGDRERFLALGFDEHLAKPLSPQALAAVLAACRPAQDVRTAALA